MCTPCTPPPETCTGCTEPAGGGLETGGADGLSPPRPRRGLFGRSDREGLVLRRAGSPIGSGRTAHVGGPPTRQSLPHRRRSGRRSSSRPPATAVAGAGPPSSSAPDDAERRTHGPPPRRPPRRP
jgi:hypothetical protein